MDLNEREVSQGEVVRYEVVETVEEAAAVMLVPGVAEIGTAALEVLAWHMAERHCPGNDRSSSRWRSTQGDCVVCNPQSCDHGCRNLGRNWSIGRGWSDMQGQGRSCAKTGLLNLNQDERWPGHFATKIVYSGEGIEMYCSSKRVLEGLRSLELGLDERQVQDQLAAGPS